MNVLRFIRRTLWSILLAICIVVGCAYIALSQVFLAPAGLTNIINESALAETVRAQGLLPRVLSATKSSPYAGLLDNKTVTDAFNASITKEAVSTKLTPAIESLSLWLNSKEPSADFSIDMTDLARAFSDQLVSRVGAKIDALPSCTRDNTLADIANGICRSTLISKEVITLSISQAIQSNNEITITPETLPLLSSNNRAGDSLPSYLNILYSISLVAAAVIGLVGLWLLFKHRLGGIITLGAACLLAAIALYVISIILTQSTIAPADNPLLASIVSSATQSLRVTMEQQAMYLAIGGTVAITIATIILVILNRRRNSHNTMRMSSDTSL